MKVFIDSRLEKKGQLVITGSCDTFELEKIPETPEAFLDLILSHVEGQYGFFPRQQPVTFILRNREVRDQCGNYQILGVPLTI